MGPRPFSRGHTYCEGDVTLDTKGFNGAATFQSRTLLILWRSSLRVLSLQWGRDLSVADTGSLCLELSRRSSFNGAATFQSRTPAVDRVCQTPHGVLQWGRDLSVADTGRDARRLRAARRASMGPRPFSRGHARRRPGQDLPLLRFNGAATFQSRTRGADRRMGAYPSQASMGPRPFSRGHAGVGRRAVHLGGASMGPRPFSCGHSAILMTVGTTCSMLQWGRDLSVADTRPARTGQHGPCARFNGAATFQSRTPGCGPSRRAPR